MARKTLIWKKWIDPFDPDPDDDIDLEDDEDIEEEEDERSYKDSYEEMENKHTVAQQKSKLSHGAGPLLVGPMGVIPINEHNQPSKVFNFWMGHTNFNIGEAEKNIVEATPGVETLEIYTRYRMRISVGQAFDEEEVMERIEKRLTSTKKKNKKKVIPKTTVGLEKFKEHLGAKYKFWAIFVLPDGELDYRTGDTEDNVKEKIASYPKKADDVLTSWEVDNDKGTTKKKGIERGVQSSPSK